MSVVNEPNKVFYQGNGTIVDFNFGFRVFSNGDLKVAVVNDDLTFSELSLGGGDYSTVLNSNGQGGIITVAVAPLATQKILIYRETPKAQSGEFTKFGFDPRKVETRLDVLTTITQDNQEQIDRSMKTSVAVEGFEPTLPADLASGDIVAINLTANGFIKGINVSQITALEAKTDAIDAAVLASDASAVAAAASEAAAAVSEANAQTSETNASVSALAAQDAANSSQWKDVVDVDTVADSPFTLTSAHAGTFFVVDTSAGDFTFNLPLISSLDLSGVKPKFGGKKFDATTNAIIVNSVGTDEIDKNGQTISADVQNNGYRFIPDTDNTPDSWTTVAIATSSGSLNPTLIEGSGGKAVTNTADMDGSGALSASGEFQVQDPLGNGLMQISAGSVIYSDLLTRVIEETNVVYSVGNNWLFNSKLSHRERIAKVTMQDSDPTKEVSLFTGSSTGYVLTIYFGDHVNHQAPFKVVCPGTGIVGHPNGIKMTKQGQAVMLRQIGTSEYVVEALNFDLEQDPDKVEIQNPDFEVDTSGWTFTSDYAGITFSRSTLDPIVGTASGLISFASTGAQNPVNANLETTFTLSGNTQLNQRVTIDIGSFFEGSGFSGLMKLVVIENTSSTEVVSYNIEDLLAGTDPDVFKRSVISFDTISSEDTYKLQLKVDSAFVQLSDTVSGFFKFDNIKIKASPKVEKSNSFISGVDGQATKLPDGTLICTKELSLSFLNTSQLEGTWTYPEPFISTPIITSNLNARSFDPSVTQVGPTYTSSASATGTIIRQPRITGLTDFSPGNTCTAYVTAIGRWK